MGGLQILGDGTIRIGELNGGYVEFPRSSWQNTTSKVQTQIANWLVAQKLMGWTVTVSSLNPPSITITSSQQKAI